MSHTKDFNHLSKNDANLAGGKGASLGEMLQHNIPVPDGYVVTADTFDHFIKETDLIQEIQAILDTVDTKAIHTVENASEKISELIKSASMPQGIADEILNKYQEHNMHYVAVRSSATAEDGADHAWAGQLSSYLNTTNENLLEMVQNCWASLFTPRAIFYRFEKGLHTTHISVAVVVQKMVNSEKSGIAFSVHPVTEDYNQIIIEAGFGLGEAIVSGSVTPDSYVVTKEPQEIIDVNVNTQNKALYRSSTLDTEHGFNEWKDLSESQANQQVLSEDQIKELSDIIVNIENHYGFPCDIEWAFEGGEFYIVQSRPITTIKNKTSITTDSVQLNPDNYSRMFSGKGLGFLNSDIFLGYYDALSVLSMQDETAWMSFLPKSSQQKTLTDGAKLYTTQELYNSYKNDFQEFMKESHNFFIEVIENEGLKYDDVKRFFELTSKHFSFYSKTEFFYTDEIDQSKMIPSIHEFDELKLQGRAFVNKMIFEEDGYVMSLLKKISEKTNVSKEQLLSYKIQEIIDLVRSGNIINTEVIDDRSSFFAGNSLEEFGKISERRSQKFFNKYREISDTIRGTVAYPGTLTAKATVLLPNWKEFSKISETIENMNQGDILVAETTSPEIMPAIKKASAIITNQGGMLSHAAIVAREMKIPCIIGTDKDVILNIKTGDLIEVNADEGVIKKLKV